MYLLVYLFYVIVVAALLWVLVSVLGHEGVASRHWRLVLSQDWWRSVERLLVRLLGLLRGQSEI